MATLYKFSIITISLLVQMCASQVAIAPKVCLKYQSRCIQGVENSTPDNTSYEAFMGLPFAKPPIGSLRFSNPVPNDPWDRVYNGSSPKSTCIQRNEFLPIANVYGSEDCLYLNVYRPKNIVNPLPVMVFIHGGGFSSGSASPLVYGPDKIMDSKKVILVTIQYRLGVLGFLSTGNSVAPGNFGLKDQAMALRWVKTNIRRFGGDAKLITVFGQSAGAASTQLHMMSPLSRGSFSRAILMSGSALAYWATPDPDPMYKARLQVAALGVSPYESLTSEEVLAILRGVDAENLVGSVDALKAILGLANSQVIFRPVIEQFVANQSFLSDVPRAVWEEGSYEQIPWMIGQVPNEGIVFSSEAYKIMSDPNQLSNFLANAPYQIPKIVGLDESRAMELKNRFFGGSSTPDWITPSNLERLGDMIGEAGFKYPLQRSIRFHLQNANLFRAPVSMYYFNFSGPSSFSYYYMSNSSLNYGISHGDDLLYLFHMPALFPELPRNSPGWIMSQKMVKFFTDFAHLGSSTISLSGSCPNKDRCEMVEFDNASSCCSINTKLINGMDPELLVFWNTIYNV